MRAGPMVGLLALALAGCDPAPSSLEAVDGPPIADAASAIDVGPPVDAERPSDAAPSDAAPSDAAPSDAAPSDAAAPPIPRVAGPPASRFDCSAMFVDPGRLSPVPLDCPLDPACDARMVVGHRGAGGQLGTIAPENSLASIRAALWMGLDGVELDVRHTADDHLVVMHDSTVDRTAMGTGAVAEMTLAELTALPLRPMARPDVPGDFGCERVPTLAEALELTRGRLFVDLDTKTSRVDLVVAAIREAGLVEEVFISVSGVERAVRARAIDPAIRVQIRPDTPEEYDAAMARFDRAPEIVEVPAERLAEMAPPIHAAGQAVFTNVFGEDAAALLLGRVELYRMRYDEGARILQTEYPPLVLEAIGRPFEGEGSDP